VAHYSSLGPKSKTFVRDVAFRPDERSMLFVYCDYWDKESFSSWDEWEGFVNDIEYESNKRTPVICEIEVPFGRIIKKEILNDEYKDIMNVFRFSNDASELAYFHEFSTDNHNVWRNISFINTETWEEKLYLQEDNKYRMMALIMDTWELKKIFFLYKHVYLTPLGGGQFTYITPKESVFTELDTENFIAREIISSDIARTKSGPRWSSFTGVAISPNKLEVALLGMVREDTDKLNTNNFEFFIVVTNLEGEARPRIKRYRLDSSFDGYWATGISWLRDDRLLVMTSRRDESSERIFYLELPDEEVIL
jgi:hypothetical protein